MSRTYIRVRGIYGGVPTQLLAQGKTLSESGVNAIWIGSGGLRTEDIALLKSQGAQVFAEFNTLHEAAIWRSTRRPLPSARTAGSALPPTAGRASVRPIPATVATAWTPSAVSCRASTLTASGSTIITATLAGSRWSRICRIPASARAVWRSFRGRQALRWRDRRPISPPACLEN